MDSCFPLPTVHCQSTCPEPAQDILRGWDKGCDGAESWLDPHPQCPDSAPAPRCGGQGSAGARSLIMEPGSLLPWFPIIESLFSATLLFPSHFLWLPSRAIPWE